MTGFRLHSRVNGKRRGGCLPGRLRIAVRRGVTLVELMISMLILAIVCIAWLQIIGIQSARKEARRREAVERLSGMMDAFMYCKKASTSFSVGGWRMNYDVGGRVDFASAATNEVFAIFDGDVSPIGYQLCVEKLNQLPGSDNFAGNWRSGSWLVGRLFNRNGKVDEVGRPFFVLPVRLW